MDLGRIGALPRREGGEGEGVAVGHLGPAGVVCGRILILLRSLKLRFLGRRCVWNGDDSKIEDPRGCLCLSKAQANARRGSSRCQARASQACLVNE